jgi:uncharacterized protein (DUF433 family)
MTTSTISEHIEISPDKCGGRPCIAGTRIRVQDIYVWHELQGQSPEEIVTDFKQLTLADVHAALAYYHDYRADIEAEVAAERAEADQLKLRNHPVMSVLFFPRRIDLYAAWA